ncbi:hypothetical protein BDV93DRAFT_513125 [Ceratobasidium sp. AG-I]|nr:hypothetical protein BDV93DRAFT_513125 [Ceratobasidium sp. AG-I]
MRYPKESWAYGRFLTTGDYHNVGVTLPAEWNGLPALDSNRPTSVIGEEELAAIRAPIDLLPDEASSVLFQLVEAINKHEANIPASTCDGIWSKKDELPRLLPSVPPTPAESCQLLASFWAAETYFGPVTELPRTNFFFYFEEWQEKALSTSPFVHKKSGTLLGGDTGSVWMVRTLIMLVLNLAAAKKLIVPPIPLPQGYDITRLPVGEYDRVLGWCRQWLQRIHKSSAELERTFEACSSEEFSMSAAEFAISAAKFQTSEESVEEESEDANANQEDESDSELQGTPSGSKKLKPPGKATKSKAAKETATGEKATKEKAVKKKATMGKAAKGKVTKGSKAKGQVKSKNESEEEINMSEEESSNGDDDFAARDKSSSELSDFDLGDLDAEDGFDGPHGSNVIVVTLVGTPQFFLMDFDKVFTPETNLVHISGERTFGETELGPLGQYVFKSPEPEEIQHGQTKAAGKKPAKLAKPSSVKKLTETGKSTKPPAQKPQPKEPHVFGPFKLLPPVSWAPVKSAGALKDLGRTVMTERDQLHRAWNALAKDSPPITEDDREAASQISPDIDDRWRPMMETINLRRVTWERASETAPSVFELAYRIQCFVRTGAHFLASADHFKELVKTLPKPAVIDTSLVDDIVKELTISVGQYRCIWEELLVWERLSTHWWIELKEDWNNNLPNTTTLTTAAHKIRAWASAVDLQLKECEEVRNRLKALNLPSQSLPEANEAEVKGQQPNAWPTLFEQGSTRGNNSKTIDSDALVDKQIELLKDNASVLTDIDAPPVDDPKSDSANASQSAIDLAGATPSTISSDDKGLCQKTLEPAAGEEEVVPNETMVVAPALADSHAERDAKITPHPAPLAGASSSKPASQAKNPNSEILDTAPVPSDKISLAPVALLKDGEEDSNNAQPGVKVASDQLPTGDNEQDKSTGGDSLIQAEHTALSEKALAKSVFEGESVKTADELPPKGSQKRKVPSEGADEGDSKDKGLAAGPRTRRQKAEAVAASNTGTSGRALRSRNFEPEIFLGGPKLRDEQDIEDKRHAEKQARLEHVKPCIHSRFCQYKYACIESLYIHQLFTIISTAFEAKQALSVEMFSSHAQYRKKMQRRTPKNSGRTLRLNLIEELLSMQSLNDMHADIALWDDQCGPRTLSWEAIDGVARITCWLPWTSLFVLNYGSLCAAATEKPNDITGDLIAATPNVGRSTTG